jgi:hypothetical protein
MAKTPATLDERRFRWEIAKFLIGAVGGGALFLIGLWQFSITARNDFAKPVLEQQIKLCMDASESAATLAQDVSRTDPDWQSSDLAVTYLALYYGKLGIVEDRCLYNAMVNFKKTVFDGVRNSEGLSANRLALTISFACRRMLSKNWSSGLVSLYDPQHLFDSFNDLEDYRNTMQSKDHCALDG